MNLKGKLIILLLTSVLITSVAVSSIQLYTMYRQVEAETNHAMHNQVTQQWSNRLLISHYSRWADYCSSGSKVCSRRPPGPSSCAGSG